MDSALIGPLIVFAICYTLIITEKMDRTAAALLGAAAARKLLQRASNP